MHKDLQYLLLRTEKGKIRVNAENYLINKDDNPRLEIKDFVENYFNLPIEKIKEIQDKISQLHCEHEMNFQVKDDTGKYSRVVSTPLQGFAPLSYKKVDSLVQSTQGLMKLVRKLLQFVYSQKKLDVQALISLGISKERASVIIEIIKDNIYYEPNLVHQNLADYPFLSLVGFDAAVSSITDPEFQFFEYNAGTPCGIEDQYQMYHHLRQEYPDFLKKSGLDQDWDNSHYLLRSTLEDCSNQWTDNQQGICVVIGPGPYSPAYPEIVSLAVNSKMPLVKISDLYVDMRGNVRLDTIKGEHPIVKGIYNRREESFLIYSQKYNIPLRSPFYRDINRKLSQEIGEVLHPGILYSYQYDNSGNITGVDLDEKGRPIHQILFDQIGSDPQTQLRSDLVEALWNKKVYISNIGGRILDDKRVFRILSESCEDKETAHPPSVVKADNLSENIDNAVIKVPDQSGGAGVLIGPSLSKKEKEEIISDVHKRPSFYEIQELSKLAVIPSAQVHEGKLAFLPLPVDWRLIVFFDSKGVVHWSQHSCLVRTANYGGLKTNTSSGGGYALGLIYTDKKRKKEKFDFYPCEYVGKTRYKDLVNFQNNLKKFLSSQDKNLIESLIYEYRDLIDFFDLKKITWINTLRKFRNEEIDPEKFISESQFIFNMNQFD